MDNRPTMKELPDSERPRERLQSRGENALSDAEILAIILRSGIKGENVMAMAQRLLANHGGLQGLARLSFQQLQEERGLGFAKAAELKAALEIGRRLAAEVVDQRAQIRTPVDVYPLVSDMSTMEQEHFRVLLLDAKNRVIACRDIYKGAADRAVVRVAEVFREAVRYNALALIMVHNHPSGDPSPSSDDLALTEACVKAGRVLSIDVYDHFIVGRGLPYSLREHGIPFC